MPELNPLPERARQALAYIEAQMEAMPQVNLRVEHNLHAGMYARTLYIPAGVSVMGALIIKPSLLIVQGHCRLYNGLNNFEIDGYQVLEGAAGRKSLCHAFADTITTMIIQTDATNIAEAEAEFTDTPERLQTNRLLEGGI